MRARTGVVRIWHWAHLVANPHCEAARETEWHLAWKILGIDGTQEVKVGRRRADVLAPCGFAVEFQASALDVDEVRSREGDWAAQGGMAWVFRADKEFAAGHLEVCGAFTGEEHLVKPENRATLDVTWRWAPVQVRVARAASFLDIGNDELVFIGAWRPGSSPLTGYGWKVSKDWVVQNLLRGSRIPAPLAGDPQEIERRIEAWERAELEKKQAERWKEQAARRKGLLAGDQGGMRRERMEQEREWMTGILQHLREAPSGVRYAEDACDVCGQGVEADYAEELRKKSLLARHVMCKPGQR
jgi:hypothetical protein